MTPRLPWISLAFILAFASITLVEWRRLKQVNIPSTVLELEILESRSAERGSVTTRQRAVQSGLLALVRSIADFIDGPLAQSRSEAAQDVQRELDRLSALDSGSESLTDLVFLQLGMRGVDLGRIDGLEFELRALCEVAASVLVMPTGELLHEGQGGDPLSSKARELMGVLIEIEQHNRPSMGWPGFRTVVQEELQKLGVSIEQGVSGEGEPSFGVVTLSEAELCSLGRRIFESAGVSDE